MLANRKSGGAEGLTFSSATLPKSQCPAVRIVGRRLLADCRPFGKPRGGDFLWEPRPTATVSFAPIVGGFVPYNWPTTASGPAGSVRVLCQEQVIRWVQATGRRPHTGQRHGASNLMC